MTETKADDVLQLGRAKALLGCSSTMSLLSGVRSITSEVTMLREELRRTTDLLEREASSLENRRLEHSAEELHMQIERNKKILELLL